MNISDEAVEAAAKATYSSDGLNAWTLEDVSTHNHYRRKARASLEAAAPHLMAQAWDEGVAYVFEGGAEVSDENPYRSAGDGE